MDKDKVDIDKLPSPVKRNKTWTPDRVFLAIVTGIMVLCTGIGIFVFKMLNINPALGAPVGLMFGFLISWILYYVWGKQYILDNGPKLIQID